MNRIFAVIFNSTIVIARFSTLGLLGVCTILCFFYSIYEIIWHGTLQNISLSGLYPGIYQYLLPPRYIVFNTVLIYCFRLPLLALFGGMFFLALLLDKIGQVLFCWLGKACQTIETT